MEQSWKEKVTSHVAQSRHPLIAVLGPTASGKTAFSLQMARFIAESATNSVAEIHESPQRSAPRMPEIVNADSRQLYRHLDIGTAKIRPEEMAGIPHHLFDVLDPKEEATAAWYKHEASWIIENILERGNLPILVGGSMLYIAALLDDLQFVAGADPALRKKLEEQYDADGGTGLYARLADSDPETAAAFSPRNKPYVIRAAEILEGGVKPSEAKRSGVCPWDLLIFGMRLPREALVRRIDARTQQMFSDGWIDEVRSLLGRGYTTLDPGMKSHGYREIAEAITNEQFGGSNEQLSECIAAKTRQYAKRQMTWWKSDQRIIWLSGEESIRGLP